MARVRSRDSALGRLLAAAPGAVYALDDQRKILYCNTACGELLGVDPSVLIGQRSDYRTTNAGTTPADIAASLCPPPDAFSGNSVVSDMALLHAQDRLLHRRVAFQPLGTDALHCVGVVAFVSDIVLADEVRADDGALADDQALRTCSHAEAAGLHHRLWTLRRGVLADCFPDELVGVSPSIQRVHEQIALASRGQARVLVCGPSGSGREHVARLLHRRAIPEPFGHLIPLCCPLLDAELLQTTITGLVRQTTLLADNTELVAGQQSFPPTLLLLEVDQLSEAAQAELAGFFGLPNFELYSIATAESSLIQLARQGRFRSDLAHALSTLTIDLPPLAQRLRDVPLLSQYFLEKFNAQGDRQLNGFSSAALDELVGYSWPDNIDELAELVEAACRGAEGPVVEVHDLPERIRWAACADAHPPKPDEPIDMDQFLAGIERELIVRALRRSKGNKTRAARLLGLNRARFHRRVAALGLARTMTDSQE